jgi:glycosyltransferase involved in cell wall biosynthesis
MGHLATALTRAGHELLVIAVHNDSSASESQAGGTGTCRIDGSTVTLLDVRESTFDAAGTAARVNAFAPEAVVGVTALGASLACRLRTRAPLWADVFGDVMAEAQAKAYVHANDAGLLRFWTVLQPVLERADHFSAVSRAQADALIGQLGLAGRLGAATAGTELVSVIPCAAEPPAPAAGGTGAEGDPPVPSFAAGAFVVLWTGSFNTWCDVDTLLDGLEHAMRNDASIVFLATGGAVPGHDERTARRFESRVRASAFADRMHLLGWVAPETVEACSALANVGVVVERDIYERRLGSENRVVQWMARGLPCITTARSELGKCLSARGLALECKAGDAQSLAARLLEAARDRARLASMGEACRAYCQEHFTFERTAAPLSEWCSAPMHAADHGRERTLSVGLMSEPKAMVRLLEAYLDELHIGQVLFRSVRWIGRRTLRGVRARRGERHPQI